MTAAERTRIEPAHSHPAAFMILMLPWGIITGYMSVAVAYFLAQAGVSTEQIASLLAIGFIPLTWKFLWAPIVDTTLTQRRWYILGALVCGAGTLAISAIPPRALFFPLLATVMLVTYAAGTLLCMSVESLMAYATPAEEKGRAGGWLQTGNLGGTGLGGGAGLWIATHADKIVAGAVLGIACLLCGLALRLLHEPPRIRRESRLMSELTNVWKDLWQVARSRLGFLALLIFFLPIGTGAATGLFSAIANDWYASADTVALVNGVLGGLAAAVGCIAGGYLSDRMDRKMAYSLFAVIQAIAAIVMAIAPRSEPMFIVFTLTYSLTNGLAYAGFTAVTLEAIGLGAAATKYTVFAALSNVPIGYMTFVEGWVQTRWGSGAMLWAEGAICLIALTGFVLVAVTTAKRRSGALEARSGLSDLPRSG
jgi:MFS transporter, PAT family, beta-lactamase induction signal transducer AmpG